MVLYISYTLLFGLRLVQCAYAKALWATEPADSFTDIIRTAYPVGNGRLAGIAYL
jgi:alpha-L-fucosidase 2